MMSLRLSVAFQASTSDISSTVAFHHERFAGSHAACYHPDNGTRLRETGFRLGCREFCRRHWLASGPPLRGLRFSPDQTSRGEFHARTVVAVRETQESGDNVRREGRRRGCEGEHIQDDG